MQSIEKLWWQLVRCGFRLLYNEMAFTYDWVSWVVSLGAWRCWQRSVFDHLPQPDAGRILEIAHGTGNLQLDLNEASYDVLGYDLSPAMGKITQNKLRRFDIQPRLTRGKAQELPFADATFLGVIATFPTDFIIQPETLREVHRVLKVDGCFIIVLNGILTGDGVIKEFLEWLYRITGQRDEKEVDGHSYFEGYGFSVKAVMAQCPNSMAQLVILTKLASSGIS